MPYKKIIFSAFILFYTTICFSQEVIEKKGSLFDNITETYHVLPDQQTRDGLYQVFYKKKHMIVSGVYEKGKKTGTWRYFNPAGALLQTYSFDRDSIVYEAFESRASGFHYFVDKDLTDSDKTTKPRKIGGRYFGYLPYVSAFKTPYLEYGSAMYSATIELLISPMGRLADFQVHVIGPDYDQNTRLSLKLFKEEDRRFAPATINRQPVICRIIIKCRVTNDGGLDFLDGKALNGIGLDPMYILPRD